ncbi:MAG TPA: adenine phosphoribosyltransferase [Candidatus Sumerlaeota bacterium]|nr:MAG: Adenine phosphoribosyltransferase [candidate division BRC1 bacterium ADurb.BinA292]HOE98005.1 adenine phosphoribosyltransferase [Candidatus Sumerlaeota bacterium]HOR29466.1 adenine phosphoribosyltransferase [Candidatus Sumerlaeota bacterium]HPK02769.1 adenine phosphoribosyltransferase [Candidatus Sumerlaeota bacterium]
MDLCRYIRDVPDFPQPGILFKDITPLLADPAAFRYVIDQFVPRYAARGIDRVVGIESRGFLFAAPVALALQAKFSPARKPGKLPYKTVEESYTLEYGTNTIALHEDGIGRGEKVLVVDDLIATGGTLAATCNLVEHLGGQVEEVATLIELTFLKGRDLLAGRPFFTLLQF